MSTILDGNGLERNKPTMCYLIVLGLENIDMMARAVCLAPNSVKVYRKECREVVNSYCQPLYKKDRNESIE